MIRAGTAEGMGSAWGVIGRDTVLLEFLGTRGRGGRGIGLKMVVVKVRKVSIAGLGEPANKPSGRVGGTTIAFYVSKTSSKK